MNRRHFLRLFSISAVGMSGCLGVTDSSSAPDESQVDVPPCPNRPDSFTEENVLQFATQFERAYLSRKTVQRLESRGATVQRVSVSIVEEPVKKTVTQATSGWVARFSVQGPGYQTDSVVTSRPTFVVNYLLGEGQILRAENRLPNDEPPEEFADPREQGTVVHCPPEFSE